MNKKDGNIRRSAQRQLRFESIEQLSKDISANIDITDVFEAAAIQICLITEATSVYICEWDSHTNMATVVSEYISEKAAEDESLPSVGNVYKLDEQFEYVHLWLQKPENNLLLQSNDQRLSATQKKYLSTNHIKTALYIPILIENQAFGFIEIYDSQEKRDFTPAEMQYLQVASQFLSIAISQANLLKATQGNLDREMQLNTLVRDINRGLDLELVLADVVKNVCEMLNADGGTLGLLSADNNFIEFPELFNESLPDFMRQPAPRGEGLVWEVVDTGLPIIIDSYLSTPGHVNYENREPDRTLLGVPIIANDKIIGGLAVYNLDLERKFTERDVSLLEAVGLQAGAAIQNARLYESTKKQENARINLLNTIPDPILLVNLAGDVIEFYKGERENRYSHLTIEENSTLHDFFPQDVVQKIMNLIEHVEFSRLREFVHFSEEREQQKHHFELRLAPYADEQVLLVVRDITEEENLKSELSYLANHDILTGLHNRVFFKDYLEKVYTRAARESQQAVLFFIDLDNFKSVNDQFNHAEGDQILKIVGGKIKDVIGEGGYISRFGGDEFTIIMENVTEERVIEIAGQLTEKISEIILLNGYQLSISCSVGICMFPAPQIDVDSVLKSADVAMYFAKLQGKDQYAFFTSGMMHSVQERIRMVTEIRDALDHEQFEIHLQPQIRSSTGAVIGSEALLRINKGSDGMVFPNVFIPVAEESGLIHRVGEVSLERVCAFIKAANPPFPIAVNISAKQFMDITLMEKITRILTEYEVDPSKIELEITESSLFYDLDDALEKLETLKQLGFSLSLDDFGTGYSSLSVLARLPIDKIKIDSSFTRNIDDPSTQAIVEGIVLIAKKLGLEIVVEGVEDKRELEYFNKIGCDVIQGFIYTRAVSLSDFNRHYL